MGYQYISCHPLTNAQLAPPFRMNGVTWTEAVNGNGTFEGTTTLPKNDDAAYQRFSALSPDDAAIYVRNTDTNQYSWGGPIVSRTWKPSTGEVSVTAVEWRSWLFNVFLSPKLDLTADRSYTWTGIDQLQIARDIVAWATLGGTADGRPVIATGSEVSGKLRDLSAVGLEFKYAGELIDTMAKRSGGFEWTIQIDADSHTGLPKLRLVFGYPEIGGLIPGLLFKRTPQGGNITLDSDIEDSVSQRRTRIWTTGSTETLPFAVDSDPDLTLGRTLLRESVTNYSSVIDRTTLSSHARAERAFRAVRTNTLDVSLNENDPASGTYHAGDRGRLVYRDRMTSLDLAAVRIIERKLTPQDAAGRVSLVLDLADYELPEVDSGGTV